MLDGLEVPAWQGAVILTGCFFTGCLLVDLVGRWLEHWGKTKWLAIGLLLANVLFAVGLSWASRAMPLTCPTDLECLTFTEDSNFIVSAHVGDTLRLWSVSGNEPEV